MPCYCCQLKLSHRTNPIPLSNTINVACHGKSLTPQWILILLVLLLAQNASPQISSTPQADPPTPPATPSSDEATVEKPDFAVKIPRINAPMRGDYYIDADTQNAQGGIYHLHGHVVIEVFDATFKADDAEYDENTDTFKAFGNVSYRNYERNEVIYCDRAEYNAETARGTFYHVKGYTKTKVVARQGMLTTQEPFYFEGEWAEKIDEKYILYNGMITDCHIPHPWWTMNAHMWDIIPEDRAITHGGVFHVHGIPLFYTPYFYKALRKQPRKSGFLTPEAGHSSPYGYFAGGGSYGANNRSYDVEYLATDDASRGIAHHLDIRGKPNEVTDFNIIAFGIDDHGGGTLSNALRQRQRHLQDAVRRWMDRVRQHRLHKLLSFSGRFSRVLLTKRSILRRIRPPSRRRISTTTRST